MLSTSSPQLPDSLSVLILAGGRSSRMGRDKASIEIDRVPMVRRIYNAAAGCREIVPAQIAIVTPWIDRYRSILPATCRSIAEPTPPQGPLVAFASGLAEISTAWVLLLACDLPNLSTSLLQSWIDELPSIPDRSMAYLPKHAQKGWEPLCGFYRHSCQESVQTYINNGGRSFQGWLKMNVITEIPIADPTCLVNCNTPADLATITEPGIFG
jgi:molybdenum cofactor guanylyltransferase